MFSPRALEEALGKFLNLWWTGRLVDFAFQKAQLRLRELELGLRDRDEAEAIRKEYEEEITKLVDRLKTIVKDKEKGEEAT